jgi:broad specificity phosphatase PhoE
MPRSGLPPQIQRALDADPFGYRYPEGESYRDVALRVGPAFERWVAAGAGSPVLFVLHGDVIRALLYHLLRFAPEKIGDFETDPCALTELRWTEGRYHLLYYNDRSHLACP